MSVCASDCGSVDRVAARIVTETVEETFRLACRQTIFIHYMQTEQVELIQVTDVLDRRDSASQVLYALVLTTHSIQHRTEGVLNALLHHLL